MKIHIYKIWFPTSEKYYIGQTDNLKRRMSCHLISKSLVGNALRKYNDWTIEILHTTKDRDTANLLEIEEIRHYNCVAPNGYNLTHGGESPPIHYGNNNPMKRPEIANKVSDALKGRKRNQFSENTKEKMSKSHKGFHHSKETKEKMSKSHSGKKYSNNHSVKSEIKRLKTRIEKLEQGL